MRIAVFDVSHWHFPLYIPALIDPGIEIVGISDRENCAGPAMAQRLSCPLLSRDALLDLDFDFALVFSRHAEMAALAQALIVKRRPFLIEKPCGLDAAEVVDLHRRAVDAGLFVSVPFILRVSDLARQLTRSGTLSPASYRHLAFRFIVGPVSRYERNGCNWMLAKRTAGGGSAINVGVHFYDLVEALTGSHIVSVRGQTRTFRDDIDVEELAIFDVTLQSGQSASIHTGYLYPSTSDDQREFSFSVSHANAYFQGYADEIALKVDNNNLQLDRIEYDTDQFYPIFLRDTLSRCRDGRPPLVGLAEAARAIAVVEAGYRSSDRGGGPVSVAVP